MDQDRLVFGLTLLFAAMTALVAALGVALREPALVVVLLPMVVLTYVFWYRSSGKLRERIVQAGAGSRRRGNAETGGFGAGPREGFESARGQRAREAWERRQQERAGGSAASGGRRRGRAGTQPSPSLSKAEAYRRLGVEPGADEAAVTRAYREKVKEVHPDRGGDEETFKEVTEAYETLTE
ncbi:J domain-containing protein [Natronomonas amylolytica]|uniref:J domain-containing protein n=1 Tax=Natronomonas amylolytica TaxID=3108498 RepID=UPI00300BBB90